MRMFERRAGSEAHPSAQLGLHAAPLPEKHVSVHLHRDKAAVTVGRADEWFRMRGISQFQF